MEDNRKLMLEDINIEKQWNAFQCNPSKNPAPISSSTGKPYTRKPKKSKKGKVMLVCHCHQMKCMQENTNVGSTCHFGCLDDCRKRFKWKKGSGGGGGCQCPVCMCNCKKAYAMSDAQAIAVALQHLKLNGSSSNNNNEDARREQEEKHQREAMNFFPVAMHLVKWQQNQQVKA